MQTIETNVSRLTNADLKHIAARWGKLFVWLFLLLANLSRSVIAPRELSISALLSTDSWLNYMFVNALLITFVCYRLYANIITPHGKK